MILLHILQENPGSLSGLYYRIMGKVSKLKIYLGEKFY